MVISMIGNATSAALACARYVLLLSCLVSCTSSPGTLALQPDFEVMTPAGSASVSMRQSPGGMTDAEFSTLIREGMEYAGYRPAGPPAIKPPYPSERIVWHVTPSGPRPTSRLVVNVFNGKCPYAYEEATVYNDESPALITSDIASMSKRLLDDIAAQANGHEVANRQAAQHLPSA
jgi:hypothetical protein